jgi:hypothetical protein
MEEARRRRDWALAERERIVAERESLRLMCDQLRLERDDAITKFANAIKDADEQRTQRRHTDIQNVKLVSGYALVVECIVRNSFHTKYRIVYKVKGLCSEFIEIVRIAIVN